MEAVTDSTRLRAILDLVEESLLEPELTGGELAARAFLSRYHFDRLVRAALGEPPGAFRRRLLLERAAHQLDSASSVIDIALESGYTSPDAFTRAFTHAFGVNPTEYRRRSRRDFRLPARNGIHYHPPGGLRLPSEGRTTTMDVLIRMYEHHIELVGQILDRMDRLDDEILDRPIELSVEHIDAEPSLRKLADRFVRQLEMWATAIEGGSRIATGGTSVTELKSRLAAAEPRFRAAVVTPVQDGRADETFLDATCAPPQTFSLGGVLAHVLTFSAARRTMAVGALATAGIDDLGAGDPMSYVGGTGDDAATITRNFEPDAS
jgi:AraC family transcriptional regulator